MFFFNRPCVFIFLVFLRLYDVLHLLIVLNCVVLNVSIKRQQF